MFLQACFTCMLNSIFISFLKRKRDRTEKFSDRDKFGNKPMGLFLKFCPLKKFEKLKNLVL